MSDVTLSDLLTSSFQTQMNNINTAIPCVIVAIPSDLEDMAVDIQPLINTKYKDGTSEELAVIYRVPVQMPGSKTTLINIPLQVGDTGLAVFSQRGMDVFKGGSGSPATPSDFRKFSMQDAVFIPGVFTFPQSPNNPAVRKWNHNTGDLTIAHNIASGTEVEIRLKQDGSLVVNTDQKVEVNCLEAEINTNTLTVNATNTTWVGNIQHTGQLINTGLIRSNNVTVSGHKHNGGSPPDAGT